ncbi:hypothetical protein ACP275_12G099000 [Erythranthe tilingii]
MRKHGWQLPYHPLQVVAVAVFLALGFAFYVFFAPFVGRQLFQYIIIGIYTPLLICAFGLYIWCAGADPADSGVFRSKKYRNIQDSKKHLKSSECKHGGGESISSSIQDANCAAAATPEESNDRGKTDIESAADCNTEHENKNPSSRKRNCFLTGILVLLPCALLCNSNEDSSDQQSEDGMFYCSLCEVEVFKYSKHCRVCDKCVDRFDHHCRWLNNCIGKRNYRKFFTLMVSSLLLLILQWSTGILVLILCFLERKRFATDISSKLGSSFTMVPFVIVVAVCTILAMIATLPLAQLFFFHILLIKKGISTYDYIIALREQEQQGAGGQQSPQMSPISSVTGLSSASSFNTFHRAAWCTPPRLFVEDQYDVVPPDNVSVSSLGKKTTTDEQQQTKKKNHTAAVKISPWTLARLNAEQVSKAAAEARKKSKIIRPVSRPGPTYAPETDSSFGSSGRRAGPRPENNRKRGGGGGGGGSSRRIRLPADMPVGTSGGFGPLHHEARSDYRPGRAIPGLGVGPDGIIVASSPESSFGSPEANAFGSGAEVSGGLGLPLSRSTSDGYDASGGEDSDRVPTRIMNRSSNWSSLLFGSEPDRNVSKYMPPSSSSNNHRKV